jgi:Zn-dependent protease with chaperone function
MSAAAVRSRRQAVCLFLVLLLLVPPAGAERTKLKPGMNFFKPADDIELGRGAAREAERELPLLGNRTVDEYVNGLGLKLARYAPGYKYPYQFKTVNQTEINAFALPGGFIYVNRGTIESAENEAQLAGVIAHEISHVALRHGTNQYSKAQLAQLGLGALGAFGGGSTGAALGQVGAELFATGVFLKFSRTAESQADLMGTQILFDAGYDAKAMAEFFDILQRKEKVRTVEFFSSHPNPENRQKKILKEVDKLGPAKIPRRDSEEFHAIQTLLRGLPAPRKGERAADTGRVGRPSEAPSRVLANYRHERFAIVYPDNWQVYESGTQVVFAPPGGVSQNAIAYGVMANVLDLDDPNMSLEEATDHLVQQMLQSNQGMREVGHSRARVGGRAALAVQLTGPSPLERERETDWLYTVRLGDDLFFILFVVPDSDSRAYGPAFQQMLDSLRFR